MSYSRSRTHEKKKARRSRRVRQLALLNVFLLVLIAVAAIWLLNGREFPRTGTAAGPGAATHASEPGASASADPSASAPRGSKAPASSGSASGDSASGDPNSDASSSDASSSDHPLPSGTDQPNAGGEDGDKLTLAFVGDLLPAGSVAGLMRKNGFDYPYREARSLLESADITAGNLESPITDRGTPEDDKQYLFRGPAEALPALKEAGFDVLNLANNHTLDYGWVGLQDTMDALDDQGLRHMGAGIDDQKAFTPVYVEAKGMTVAFLGVTNVVPKVSWKADRQHPGVAEIYNATRAIAAVKAAKENADLVVVMVHWGVEKKDTPINDQVVKGRQLIDAGADLVIGSHPHVLQGFESYNGKWIAYSLGNFVFNTTASPKTSETGVLTASCAKGGGCDLQFHPMLARNSQPAPMDETAGQTLLSRLAAVSATVNVEENGDIVEKR
ncbi:CapA family protein [Cohnella caldifontis]|uniref:CapA family protein n=1 Tax=Cohnella caldifontis TaxID=3027471 RepID=UPI0023EBA896|nr:CapA family protein [Cohnella sp. YIM B05605]